MKLEVFVAGKPVSRNSAYGIHRSGHGNKAIYLTTRARIWKEAVFIEVLQALWHTYKLTASQAAWTLPLVISYAFQGCPGDADNHIKLVQDGIKKALGIDDKHFQIGSASVTKRGTPGVFLVIEDGEGGGDVPAG